MGLVRVGELKRGMVLLIDQAPCIIEDLRPAGTAQTKRKVHVLMRNLSKNQRLEKTYVEEDRVTTADMEQRSVTFSYLNRDQYVFLDNQTYEEVSLSSEQIGERKWFLKENAEYKAVFINGQFLDIILPDHMTMKVEMTAPPQRSNNDSTWKTAKLEGGLEVLVPLFIAPGEMVRIDTHTKKYMSKETEH